MNKLQAIGLSATLLLASGSAMAHGDTPYSDDHSVSEPAVAVAHVSKATHAPAPAGKSGFYSGMGVGEASISFNGAPESDEDVNIRAFMGYQLNQYFAVEAGLSSMPFDNILGAADLTGMDISLLAKLPVTSRFSAYGRLGYWDWDVSVPYYGTYYDLFGGTDKLYGIGLEYKLTSALTLRLDATRYEVSDSTDEGEIDSVTANLAYNF